MIMQKIEHPNDRETFLKSVDIFINQRQDLCDEIIAMMKGKMTDKNLKLLGETMMYLDEENLIKLLDDSSKQEENKTIATNIVKLLERTNEFSPGVHKAILPSSQFSDKYNAVIETCRKLWHDISKKNTVNFLLKIPQK